MPHDNEQPLLPAGQASDGVPVNYGSQTSRPKRVTFALDPVGRSGPAVPRGSINGDENPPMPGANSVPRGRQAPQITLPNNEGPLIDCCKEGQDACTKAKDPGGNCLARFCLFSKAIFCLTCGFFCCQCCADLGDVSINTRYGR